MYKQTIDYICHSEEKQNITYFNENIFQIYRELKLYILHTKPNFKDYLAQLIYAVSKFYIRTKIKLLNFR